LPCPPNGDGLTIGSGGSSGVFAPSLCVGALLSTAFGSLAGTLLPDQVGPPGAYGLVGGWPG